MATAESLIRAVVRSTLGNEVMVPPQGLPDEVCYELYELSLRLAPCAGVT